MNRKKWLVVAGGVLALGAALSACEDKLDKAAAEAPKSSAGAPAAVSPQSTTEAPKPASGIPSPDQAQTVALVAALRAVDPALVVKEDRAVSRARNTCLDVRQGKDAATVQKNTASRFTGGSVTVTDGQAARIVEVVKATFCG
ncbi:hypothetical protein CFP65_1705 [Kitasatospora sp. MMS16-BH015]|uniref:hypothetical protein n=1 Tax=Kitasatospora sp. MMS16-BH015 TaxID=2018025 RepID=UPI000CA1DC64|nr:hypothetical protein [Kitasatospora sp. MMS16-BH015]AUG76585.1 hypothetical protein CFP65_1705 [Kitasatospora sp. MMS16-BH015]